jgi:hypothetical protein
MRIFISYSSKDRNFVTTLADDLELMEHIVWFDRELNRSGGHRWWALICAEIRKCDVFLYALSPHVLKSEPCRREHQYALALHKPVLPVILAELDLRYLPHNVKELQLVKFTVRTKEQKISLRDSLKNLPACPPLPANAIELEPPVPIDPVGALIERIKKLSADSTEQKLLILDVDDLEEEENGQYASHIPELLHLLVKRGDVLNMRNMKRVHELMDKYKVKKSATPVPPAVPRPGRWMTIQLLMLI